MHIFVIIPCYNCSKYLQTAIDSVLSNTTDEIRINVILVDDGSTDDTASLCDQNAQNNERVFAIHKTNGGVSSARNAGIDYVASCFPDSISNGYIAFLDVPPENNLGRCNIVLIGYPNYRFIIEDFRSMSSSAKRIP